MAEAAGAALTEMDRFYGHVQARDAMDDPELWPYPTIDFPIAAGIAVDKRGRRFTDEGLAGVSVANAIARLDDPLGAVAIFDQAIWEASGKTYVCRPIRSSRPPARISIAPRRSRRSPRKLACRQRR